MRVPEVLRFGSWVGGDMDGNPNVTAATIRESLERHRSLILGRYRDEILGLWERLTQSTARVGVDPAVEERIAEYRARFPARAAEVRPRHRDMPYRVLLQLIDARLQATGDDAAERLPAARRICSTICARSPGASSVIAASTPVCSGCVDSSAASAPSAFTWRRSTCVRTRAFIARWWAG